MNTLKDVIEALGKLDEEARVVVVIDEPGGVGFGLLTNCASAEGLALLETLDRALSDPALTEKIVAARGTGELVV